MGCLIDLDGWERSLFEKCQRERRSLQLNVTGTRPSVPTERGGALKTGLRLDASLVRFSWAATTHLDLCRVCGHPGPRVFTRKGGSAGLHSGRSSCRWLFVPARDFVEQRNRVCGSGRRVYAVMKVELEVGLREHGSSWEFRARRTSVLIGASQSIPANSIPRFIRGYCRQEATEAAD